MRSPNTIPWTEIYSEEFIKEHTAFESLDEFIRESNIMSLGTVNSASWEYFVIENTTFSSWSKMQTSAIAHQRKVRKNPFWPYQG